MSRSSASGSARPPSVGHVLVGGNPNHSGDELSRDISHTECQLVVTDMAHLPLVDGLDLGPNMGVATEENPPVLLVDSRRATSSSLRACWCTDP